MVATNKLERGFTLTWILDAPRVLVFQAWTDPRHLQWFFNDGVAIPPDPTVVDLRVGGVWRQKMVVNHDTAYFTGGIYREIVPGGAARLHLGRSGRLAGDRPRSPRRRPRRDGDAAAVWRARREDQDDPPTHAAGAPLRRARSRVAHKRVPGGLGRHD